MDNSNPFASINSLGRSPEIAVRKVTLYIKIFAVGESLKKPSLSFMLYIQASTYAVVMKMVV